MSNNDKSGVVVLGKADKKKRFNLDLKNTMGSVVGGAGEASLPNSAPTPSGGVVATGDAGAVMASVDDNMFLQFMDKIRTPDNELLVESIILAYNTINEAYEDVYTQENDAPSYSAYGDEGASGGSYKYEEPLDIYVDMEEERYPTFKVYTDGGDLLYNTSNINDAYKFIKETGNTLGHKPIKSYGNRWLNHGDKYTLEDLVYIMDKNGGRTPFGLVNVSDEEIENIRQHIK